MTWGDLMLVGLLVFLGAIFAFKLIDSELSTQKYRLENTILLELKIVVNENEERHSYFFHRKFNSQFRLHAGDVITGLGPDLTVSRLEFKEESDFSDPITTTAFLNFKVEESNLNALLGNLAHADWKALDDDIVDRMRHQKKRYG